MGKSNKFPLKIRQMLLRSWRKTSASRALPPDVPDGHVAICVGSSFRRFVVPATLLNHPVFRRLFSQAEEEYGFGNYAGPVAIPCEESIFEEILQSVSRGEPIGTDFTRCRHVSGMTPNPELFNESGPLISGFTASR